MKNIAAKSTISSTIPQPLDPVAEVVVEVVAAWEAYHQSWLAWEVHKCRDAKMS